MPQRSGWHGRAWPGLSTADNAEPVYLAKLIMARPLLATSQALPVQPDEGEQLDRVIKKFDRWGVSHQGHCSAGANWKTI